MSYDDGRVAFTEDSLVIRGYYLPWWPKRIRYSDIKRVRRRPMSGLTGKYRIWGSGDFVHWWNIDPHRPDKATAFEIELSRGTIRPMITPDDPDQVAAELATRGLTVAGS
jgi:hypothetical protein